MAIEADLRNAAKVAATTFCEYNINKTDPIKEYS